MDKKELINFEGLDFNEVQNRKAGYLLPAEFSKMIGEEGLDLEEDLFYFGEIARHITEVNFSNAVVLKDTDVQIAYPDYYNFCCRLDRECYRLMNEDETENKSFSDFIGFHPGRLFGKTVDGGSYGIFKFLYECYYIDMHDFALLGVEEKEYISLENDK